MRRYVALRDAESSSVARVGKKMLNGDYEMPRLCPNHDVSEILNKRLINKALSFFVFF